VNVTVENLAPCKKLLRIEFDTKAVDEAFETATKEFQRHARLPGFRAGKAPRDMIEKRFEKDIEAEVKRTLLSKGYKDATQEHKIKVIGSPDVEEIQFGKGQALIFAVTVETAPEFQLPEYRRLPAKRRSAVVRDEDMERAFKALQERAAKFENVNRPAQPGDILVITYSATSDGKPLTDFSPELKSLTENKDFWVEIKAGSFIPGFTEQLVGAASGELRTIRITFPTDGISAALAGKEAVYEVQIKDVKERLLPAIDDAFARSYEAENLEKLREGVRADLQREKNFQQNRDIRGQLMQGLMGRINYELPESAIQAETRRLVYDLVHQNQQRGVGNELIQNQKEQIYSAANQTARERLKAAFLIERIAQNEGIQVTEPELSSRVGALARKYSKTAVQMAKEMEKSGAIHEVFSQLLHDKVVDFLQQNAQIEDAPDEQPPA